MSRHRPAIWFALAILAVGCADDPKADPTPVTAGSSTTAAAVATTTGAVGSTTVPEAAPTSTTPASPPVTKPLTTAPPSPLLDEVTAVYDAANQAIDAAFSYLGDANPDLTQFIAGPQLQTWEAAIRSAEADGIVSPSGITGRPWHRVEQIEVSGDDRVALTVCRYDGEETTRVATGEVVEAPDRAYRYVETFERGAGRWRWVGREWIDPPGDDSDCAQPQ